MEIKPDVKKNLLSAVRDAKINIIGYDLVKNDSEARLLTAIIKAYGDSPAGFIYAAPSRARSTLRPPDVVLCHPDVGLLVIEAKGFGIDDIQGVEAGSIKVKYQGYMKPDNVIRQVEDQMFEIEADVRNLIRDRRQMPLMNCMVSFPRIFESQWVSKGYDKAHPSTQFLFADQIETQSRLKSRINNLVKETLKESHKEQPLTSSQIQVILKVFGNSDVINENRPPRQWVEEDKLGSYVDEMVTLEKYLSEEQKELSRLEFEGTQRLIRGVAGSGKSVVLANLVARYLHRELSTLEPGQSPELKVSIAVTCFNHALVDFLKQKIRTAYRTQTLTDDIPANIMVVTHLNNLIYTLIKERGWQINYIRVQDVPNATDRAKAYLKQIEDFKRDNPAFYESICLDALFVDEGQDFEPDEYKLLLSLIRPHPKTGEKPLVIFYDDAQNLYGRSRPNWRELGINVAVGDRTRVMRTCFRNTRQIVELAFNVLLGSQASGSTRVYTRTYADVQYLKERGLIEETGDHFRVRYAEREYQPPIVRGFSTEREELDWLVAELSRLICDQNVRPEDILVIFNKPGQFKYQFVIDQLQRKIPGIKFILPFGQNEDKDHYIFQTDHLTLSTVYGAKGYDAPIVFLVGADRFETTREGRAGFYVAATRAKLLLYVSGVIGKQSLLEEAQSVLKVL